MTSEWQRLPRGTYRLRTDERELDVWSACRSGAGRTETYWRWTIYDRTGHEYKGYGEADTLPAAQAAAIAQSDRE